MRRFRRRVAVNAAASVASPAWSHGRIDLMAPLPVFGFVSCKAAPDPRIETGDRAQDRSRQFCAPMLKPDSALFGTASLK